MVYTYKSVLLQKKKIMFLLTVVAKGVEMREVSGGWLSSTPLGRVFQFLITC